MNSILACIDFSDVTDRILSETGRLAKALGAQVQLFHVIPPSADLVMLAPGGVMGAIPPPDPSDVSVRLNALTTQLSAMGVITSHKVERGDVVSLILSEAQALQPERIILGSHGHGRIYKLLVGSVAEAILRRSKVPVLVIPSLV